MQQSENLICTILRGENVPWQDEAGVSESDFYRVSSEHGVTALVYYGPSSGDSLSNYWAGYTV